MRLFGWWFVAEDMARLLSAPPVDAARSDRDVEDILRDSALGAAARTLAEKTGRAWANARAIAVLTPIVTELFPSPLNVRVRVVGLLAVISSVTALVFQALKPAPPGPFTWAPPAAVAAAGVIIACAAAPLARALAAGNAKRGRSA